MDLIFLGTSSGVPTKQRNVSGVALTEPQGRGWFLIDCGEGTQHQLLHTRLSAAQLKAILITHVHGDHCYGLPGLLASAAMSGRQAPLTIIAPAGIAEWLEAVQAHTALALPYALDFVATETLDEITIGAYRIQSTPLSHRVPSYAYQFTEHAVEGQLKVQALKAAGIPAGPLWGQLQRGHDVQLNGQTYCSADYVDAQRAPRQVVIAGDNDTPSLLTEACRHAQLLIHEATYTQDIAQKVGDVGHSDAARVAQFAEQQGLPALILTHFSPRYHLDPRHSPSLSELEAEAGAAYTGTLKLAQDFDHYHLDKNGLLTQKTET